MTVTVRASDFSGVMYAPVAHDETAEWTNADLAAEISTPPLALSANPAAGAQYYASNGDSCFIRRIDGPVGAGQVWYIHGLTASSTNWTPLAELLRPDATGMAVDLPGNGRSDPMPRSDYRVRTVVRLLIDLIARHGGGPVHLVGNSYGGYLAALIAALAPEQVRTLTLISPAVPDLRLRGERGADPRLAVLLAPGMARLAEPRLAAVSTQDRVNGVIQMCFGDPTLVTETDLEAAVADTHWRRDLPWVQGSLLAQLRGLMQHYLLTGRSSWWSLAARVTAPTLVIWGTRDRLVDVRLAKRTAEAFNDAQLLVLSGVGHAAHMEDPITTSRAIRALWLRAA